MKKLVGKTKYIIDSETGTATIYACLKGTTKYIAAFTCHSSCIDVIQQEGNFDNPNVILRPVD